MAHIDIQFRADTKAVTKALSNMSAEMNKALKNVSFETPKKEIIQASVAAQQFQKAMEKASLANGKISFASLQGQLKTVGTSINGVISSFAKGGEQFNASFAQAVTTLATADRTALSLSNKLKETARVFSQSFKYTLAQQTLNALQSSLASTVRWVQELNSQLAEISVVTGKTGADLDRIGTSLLENSQKLHVAASEYAEAAILFYQQGLNSADVEKMASVTIKAAKAAGASISEMASELTAIKNTYQMSVDQMETSAAIAAKLGAETAVRFEDIAIAMQTAATAASQMGVSYESLAAIIATVGDATQESASIIGNAYKTIFSRFEQLKVDGTDGEVTLNTVSAGLAKVGINVLDAAGNLRELDDVIMETGKRWDTFSDKQQLAIAELVGGTRQYGQFLALMQNFDKYLDNLGKAKTAGPEDLEAQFTVATDTIEHRAEMAAEAWQSAFSQIITEDNLKIIYEASEALANGIGSLISGLGGLPGILSIVGKMFSDQIASSMVNIAYTTAEWVKGLKNAATIEDQINAKATELSQSITSIGTATTTEQRAARQTLENYRQIAEAGVRINALKSSANELERAHGKALEKSLNTAIELKKTSLTSIGEMSKKGKVVDPLARNISDIFGTAADVDQTDSKAFVDNFFQSISTAIDSNTSNYSQILQKKFHDMINDGLVDPTADDFDLSSISEIFEYLADDSELQEAAPLLSRNFQELAENIHGVAESNEILRTTTEQATQAQNRQRMSAADLAKAMMYTATSVIQVASAATNIGNSLGNWASGTTPDLLSVATSIGMITAALAGLRKAILGTSAASLANPITAGVAVIGAIITAISAFMTYQDNLIQKHKEAAEAAAQQAEATAQLAETVGEANTQVQESLEKMDKLNSSSEEWSEEADKIEAAYEKVLDIMQDNPDIFTDEDVKMLRHLETLAKLTGCYDDLAKAIQGVYDAMNEESVNDAEAARVAAGEEVSDASGHGFLGTSHTWDMNSDRAYREANEGLRRAIKDSDKYNGFAKFNRDALGDSVSFDYGDTAEEQAQAYQKLIDLRNDMIENAKKVIDENDELTEKEKQQAKDDLYRSQQYQALTKEIDKLKEATQKYDDAVEKENEAKAKEAEKGFEETKGMSLAEYQEWKRQQGGKYSQDTYERNAVQETIMDALDDISQKTADRRRAEEQTGPKAPTPQSLYDMYDKYIEEGQDAVAQALLNLDMDRFNAMAKEADEQDTADIIDRLAKKQALENGMSSYQAEANKYDNAREAYQNYHDAVANSDDVRNANVAAAQSELNYQIALGKTAEALDLTTEALDQEVQKVKADFGYKDIDKQKCLELVAANHNMNKAIDDCTDSMKRNAATIRDQTSSAEDYANAMTDVKKAIRGITGASDDLEISDDFAKDHLDLLEQITTADEETAEHLVNVLGVDLAEEMADAWQFDKNFGEAFGVDESRFTEAKNTVLSFIQGLNSEVLTELENGTKSFGDVINETTGLTVDQFYTAFNEAAAAAGMSFTEMEKMWQSLGFPMNVVTDTKPLQNQEPGGTEVTSTEMAPTSISTEVQIPNPDGTISTGTITYNVPNWKSEVKTAKPEDAPIDMTVGQINTKEGSNEKPKFIGTNGSGLGRNKSDSKKNGGSGGKSGGYKSTYKKPTQHKRYVNTKNKISQNSKDASKLAAIEEKATGPIRMAAFEQKAKLLQQEYDLYKKLAEEAANYLETDKQALLNNGYFLEIGVKLDTNNFLLNEEELQNHLDDLKDRIGQAEDAEKDRLQQMYDEAEQALKNYIESYDQQLEAQQSMADAYTKQIEADLEQMNYALEIHASITERELARISRAIEQAGTMGVLAGETIDLLGEKLEDVGQQFIEYESRYNEVIEKWQNTGRDEYMKQAESYLDSLVGYAEELRQAFVDMWTDCTEALQNYVDQFNDLFTKIENKNSILDMMETLWGVSRDQYTNTDVTKKMRESRLNTGKSQITVAKNELEALRDIYNEAENTYQEALDLYDGGDITGEQLDAIKQYRDEAKSQFNSAQQEYYQSVMDYVEQVKEAEVAAAEEIIDTWKKNLSGQYLSTERYDQEMTLQNYYLDAYEKDYALDKLERQVDDALENVTDPSLIKKYKAYLDEINESRAEGVKLTQEDVDIMQAKLELIQAEEALEDARNAKNTMRLQRDASGNYSYVYSGDDTTDAEQAVDDAYNNWYELVKNAADTASTEWYKVYNEYIDFIANIDQARYESEEKYRQEVDQQTAYYKEYLSNLSSRVDDYNGQIGRSYEDTAIGIMTDYASMQETQTNFTAEAERLNAELAENHVAYQTIVDEVTSSIVGDYENLAEAATASCDETNKAMESTEAESISLRNQMTSDMDDIVSKTQSWTQEMIDQYNSLIAEIDELISKFNQLAAASVSGSSSNASGEWKQDETGWWYGNDSGYLANGWYQLSWSGGTDWFYFDENGYMLENTTTPDGFYVDENGAWDGEYPEGYTPGSGNFSSANWKAYSNSGSSSSSNYSGNSGTNYSSGPNDSIDNGTYVYSGGGSIAPDGYESDGYDDSSGGPGGNIYNYNYNYNYNNDNSTIIEKEVSDPIKDALSVIRTGGYIKKYADGGYINKDSDNKNIKKYADGGYINKDSDNKNIKKYADGGYINKDSDNKNIKKYADGGLATLGSLIVGGYTGNNGTHNVDTLPALLTAGEYVLNTEDTARILQAAQAVQNLDHADMLSALAAKFTDIDTIAKETLNVPNAQDTTNQQIQQEVHIDATFPNVSVANEIEEAFSNLVNETVQLAMSR